MKSGIAQFVSGRTMAVMAALVLAAVAAVLLLLFRHHRPAPPVVSAARARAASHPVAAAAQTRPSEPPKQYETSYLQVIRADIPALRKTEPLAVPLELSQAARIVLHDPVYLSRERGDLWITRSDAPPIEQVLRQAVDPNADDPQTHVLREQTAYVHWVPLASGAWTPYLICRGRQGSFDVIWAGGRQPLPRRDFIWDRGFFWNARVVVPSRTGVSIFEFGPQIKESYHDLPRADSTGTQPSASAGPEVLPDEKGLLAWIPWESGKPGSRGAIRFVDDRWIELGADQGWPQKLVHLVPLRDGTVFQFYRQDDGTITLESMALDRSPVDPDAVARLVAQLGDVDPDVRRKAFTDLANFGPGAWPILEKLSDNQPPQARLMLRQLLKDRSRPSLSGLTLLGSRSVELAARLSDGGVVFYAPQGVASTEPDGQQTITAPAWLSIRPGHYVELLPPALVVDLKPGQSVLDVVGDQWIVNSDVRGPRLFYGNGLATLLRKDERQFSRVIGMDQRGRWLFRAPAGPDPRPTLIIDPHYPDPTPRLPVWQLAIADTVGWDKDNWPVLQHGGAFALTESDWRPLDKDEIFSTRADQILATTLPATRPTTGPTSEPAEKPLLITTEGTRYYGGLSDLTVIRPDGKRSSWPLPAVDNGVGPAWLVRDKNGKFFLFNQPGRVIRLSASASVPEPFVVDAVFTHDIPVASHPTRIWLDPAGRIDIEWENRLAVLFPQGYIPRAISEKMLEHSPLDAEP